jgi:membrane protease YdiL (CAAX protease family)
MPYALFAGIIFITVDLLSESIFPSIILHFCNNVLSLAWIFFAKEPKYAIIISVSLVLLSLISVIAIIIDRKRHLSELSVLLRSGDSYKIGYAPLAVAVPTVFFAISELIG